MLKLGTCVEWTSPINGQSFRGIICGYPPGDDIYEVHHARQIHVMNSKDFIVLHGPCDGEIADLSAQIKAKSDHIVQLQTRLRNILALVKAPLDTEDERHVHMRITKAKPAPMVIFDDDE